MKILIVTGIFPPDIGGPASYVPAIARALAERHEILAVVTLSDSLDHDDSAYGFPVVRIPRGMGALARRRETIGTIKRLAAKADVVYLNGLVLEGILAVKVFSRKPAVVKVVGDLIWERARNAGVTDDTIDAFQTGRYGPRWEFLKRLQGWYTAKADAVITPSRYLAEVVAGWGVPPERVHVVYNAVESAPGLPAPAGEPVELVTVARLVPWKGVDALIDVARRHDWRLNVIGDGPLRGELERRAEGARVTFLGHITHERVAAEIARGKVFVLNSTYEGLPHIVLEAKAAGVPVVATAVGGTPETIHDGVDGYLVPPRSEPLAERLAMLLDDGELRARLAAAGRQQVESHFSFEAMVRGTERVLALCASVRA